MITPLDLPQTWSRLVDETRTFFSSIGAQRAVIGLSGGIDCALVAVIATEALGAHNVAGVRMPSHHTSRASLKDAFDLADNLGIDVLTVPIAQAYTAATTALIESMNPDGSVEELRAQEVRAKESWVRYDPVPGLAEENIQSRLRGLMLMTISNKTGALVLNTGNRSELLTGYFTVHGDSVGAFAPIAGLYKTQVYEISNWYNRHDTVIPVSTMTKAPTAELAPNQTDQDSLPSYEVLDPALDVIERYVAAGGDMTRSSVADLMHTDEADGVHGDPEVMGEAMRLWRTSAFKRTSRLPTVQFL